MHLPTVGGKVGLFICFFSFKPRHAASADKCFLPCKALGIALAIRLHFGCIDICILWRADLLFDVAELLSSTSVARALCGTARGGRSTVSCRHFQKIAQCVASPFGFAVQRDIL